jgi:hypothetical protein
LTKKPKKLPIRVCAVVNMSHIFYDFLVNVQVLIKKDSTQFVLISIVEYTLVYVKLMLAHTNINHIKTAHMSLTLMPPVLYNKKCSVYIIMILIDSSFRMRVAYAITPLQKW